MNDPESVSTIGGRDRHPPYMDLVVIGDFAFVGCLEISEYVRELSLVITGNERTDSSTIRGPSSRAMAKTQSGEVRKLFRYSIA